MNRVVLIGRLTRDPELRTTTGGVSNCTFSIAVNRNFKNKEGNIDADFFNIVVWRKQAENVSKYCSKGTQVCVEGRLQSRSYEAQDGTKRYVTEVVADNVTFLSPKTSGSSSSYQSSDTFSQSNDMPTGNDIPSDIVTTDISEDPFKEFGQEVVLSEDDLPF